MSSRGACRNRAGHRSRRARRPRPCLASAAPSTARTRVVRRRRLGAGCSTVLAPWRYATSPARRWSACALLRLASPPRCGRSSTGSCPVAAEPIWRCSTSTCRLRPAAATSSSARSPASSRREGSWSSETGSRAARGACLFNSFNFDFRRLRRFARDGGAHGAPRRRADRRVSRVSTTAPTRASSAINRALAAATVFQSHWSLERHRELGLELRSPTVIHNAVDPAMFHPPDRSGAARRPPGARRRDELVGQPAEGRGCPRLARPARGSRALRAHVRGQDASPARAHPCDRAAGLARARRRACDADLYLAASRDDPCSNALLEALACGLPAAFLASGGHPELVGEAGSAVRLARGATRCRSSGWSASSRSGAARSAFPRSRTSPTATSKSSS